MTVAENICLTLGYPRRGRLIDWRAARERAARALNVLDADIDPDVRIQSLSRTEKSLVAIARALAAEAEVLVLDEPTASLPADEVARLFVALRRLRDRGVGIIYVSHRLDEVFEIADRMVVLRDGRVAGERRVDQTTPEEVILLIVGREPSQVFRRPARRMGQPRMALQSVMVGGDRTGRLRAPCRRGGRFRRLARRRPGKHRPGPLRHRAHDGGRILLDGKPIAPATPRQAMANGINLVCADRAGEVARTQPDDSGKSLSQPARGRLAPSVAAQSRPREPARRSSLASGSACGRTIRSCPSSFYPAAISRRSWSVAGCIWPSKVYVFEDPTAGVDVGAKAEIYRLFDVALSNGAAIIIVSTDFEEVAKVCHRALVFDRGRVVAELGDADLAVENLLAAASASVGQMAATSPGGHRPCSPLNRTRWSRPGPSLPRCRVGRRSPGCSRSMACRS